MIPTWYFFEVLGEPQAVFVKVAYIPTSGTSAGNDFCPYAGFVGADISVGVTRVCIAAAAR